MAVVYQHILKDTREVFYVGIGNSTKRAFDKSRRGKFWKDFTSTHDYEVVILHKDISWEEACQIEIALIVKYGRRDLKTGILINQTDGGEGLKNLSEESRNKMAVNKGKFKELNYFYGKKHTGDLSRFGTQNIGREPYMKGKKHEGDLSRFGIQNIGRGPHNQGLICINNTIINKYIKQNDLEDYIKNGWSIGGKKRKFI